MTTVYCILRVIETLNPSLNPKPLWTRRVGMHDSNPKLPRKPGLGRRESHLHQRVATFRDIWIYTYIYTYMFICIQKHIYRADFEFCVYIRMPANLETLFGGPEDKGYPESNIRSGCSIACKQSCLDGFQCFIERQQ